MTPVVHQPQPDQAVEGRSGGWHARRASGGFDGGAGDGQAGGEQAGGAQHLGLFGGERLAVGVEGHALEEGDGGVARVGRHALVDEGLDVGRRHAALPEVFDVCEGLACHRVFTSEEGAGQGRLQARVALRHLQGALQEIGVDALEAFFLREARGGAQLLAPVGLVHRLQGDVDQALGQIAPLCGGEGEAVAAGDEEAGRGLRPLEGIDDGRQGGTEFCLHRRGAGFGLGRGLEDALQVVDDEQDGGGVEGAFEEGLEGLGKRRRVRGEAVAPGVDGCPAGGGGDCLGEAVEDGEGVVSAEDHDFSVAGVAGGDAVGEAGLAEVAHAVHQHAAAAVAEGPDHVLNGAPPADELPVSTE